VTGQMLADAIHALVHVTAQEPMATT